MKEVKFIIIAMLLMNMVTWFLIFQGQMWEIKQELSDQIACQINPDFCKEIDINELDISKLKDE